jgi:membrane-associated phospholipid phosphatase
MRFQSSFFCLVLALAAPGWASSSEPRPWRPVGAADYFLIGGLTGTTLLASRYRLKPNPDFPTLTWDEEARNSIRAGSARGRLQAATISDVALGMMVAAPFLNEGWHHFEQKQEWSTTQRALVTSLEAYSVTGLLVVANKNLFQRPRPYSYECAGDPHYDKNCFQPDATMSFFSGHTAFAFTGAGLVCSFEQEFRNPDSAIFENPACLGAIGISSTVGLMRIRADKHFLTDVLAGAVIGFSSGYFLPKLLHKTKPSIYGSQENAANKQYVFSLGWSIP